MMEEDDYEQDFESSSEAADELTLFAPEEVIT